MKIEISRPDEQLNNIENKPSVGSNFNVSYFQRNTRINEAVHFALNKMKETKIPVPDLAINLLKEVDELSAANDTHLRLRDLKPVHNPDEMQERLKKISYLPTDNPEYQKFIRIFKNTNLRDWGSPEDKAFFNKQVKKVNELIYQKIEKTYHVKDGCEFFNVQMSNVKHAIAEKTKEEESTLSPVNEDVFASPAKMVLLSLLGDCGNTLRTEIAHNFVLSEISSKVSLQARGLKECISEIHDWLDIDIFDPEKLIGEGQNRVYFGFFDNETNEPLWLSGLDKPLSKQTYEELTIRAHLKKIIFRMRDTQKNEEIGPVFTQPKEKQNGVAVDKVLRKADQRNKLLGDDYLETLALRDLGGVMFITEKDTSERLRDRVKKMLVERMDIAEEVIIDNNGTDKEEHEKNGHEFCRFRVRFPGLKGDIEFIFVNLKQAIKNELTFGKLDPETGKLNGSSAHLIYEIDREEKGKDALFPSETHGKRDPSVTAKKVENAIFTLRRKYRIPVSELPKELLDFDQSLI